MFPILKLAVSSQKPFLLPSESIFVVAVILIFTLIFFRPEELIDHWEVDGNLVSLEEEIGEGAFGKVYKGTLNELTTNAQKPFLKSSMKTTRSINGSEMFTVAVKMLHSEYRI